MRAAPVGRIASCASCAPRVFFRYRRGFSSVYRSPYWVRTTSAISVSAWVAMLVESVRM
jgi:hypothetical protein